MRHDNEMGQYNTYPTAVIRFRAAIGKMVPPTDEPMATSPKARPRFLWNQCEMTATHGPNIIPAEILEQYQSCKVGDTRIGIESYPNSEPLA